MTKVQVLPLFYISRNECQTVISASLFNSTYNPLAFTPPFPNHMLPLRAPNCTKHSVKLNCQHIENWLPALCSITLTQIYQ